MNTLIVDTETTSKNTVADFGAVVVDENGKILEQFGVLLHGHFAAITAPLLMLFSLLKCYTVDASIMTKCSKMVHGRYAHRN